MSSTTMRSPYAQLLVRSFAGGPGGSQPALSSVRIACIRYDNQRAQRSVAKVGLTLRDPETMTEFG